MPSNEVIQGLGLDDYKFGFITDSEPVFKTRPGLDAEVVRQISARKDEPEWMLKRRLKALRIYDAKPMPQWGGDLSELEETLSRTYFYSKPQEQMERSWDDVPESIKGDLRAAGNPRGGAEDPGGASGRSTIRRWSTTR